MKNIIICSDGTWQSPESDTSTHILRIARGIAPEDAAGNKQVVFYDWGVGSDGNPLTGGATGKGIDKNILDCYRFLVHNYDDGDAVYLFGFSRGAYTVRSLAGLIGNCGILRREHAGKAATCSTTPNPAILSTMPAMPFPLMKTGKISNPACGLLARGWI